PPATKVGSLRGAVVGSAAHLVAAALVRSVGAAERPARPIAADRLGVEASDARFLVGAVRCSAVVAMADRIRRVALPDGAAVRAALEVVPIDAAVVARRGRPGPGGRAQRQRRRPRQQPAAAAGRAEPARPAIERRSIHSRASLTVVADASAPPGLAPRARLQSAGVLVE